MMEVVNKSPESSSLTDQKYQCGHCFIKAQMKILCEAEEFHDMEYGDWLKNKWKTTKCLACSKVNFIRLSSSSLWEYQVDADTDFCPTYTDFLYPLQEEQEPKHIELKISNETIQKAIIDAEILIRENDASSGLDRLHTALHGHLRVICAQANISYSKEDAITRLFSLIRDQHPALEISKSGSKNAKKFFRSCAAMIDSLNTIRNHETLAHANSDILEKEEAEFIVSVTRSLLLYLDKKLKCTHDK